MYSDNSNKKNSLFDKIWLILFYELNRKKKAIISVLNHRILIEGI